MDAAVAQRAPLGGLTGARCGLPALVFAANIAGHKEEPHGKH